MGSINWPLFIGTLIFLVICGAFLNMLVFQPKRIRTLFEKLKPRGYFSIDKNDAALALKMHRLFWEHSQEDTLQALQAMAWRDFACRRYICDIHYAYSLADEAVNMYYAMYIEARPLETKTDIFICRKIPSFVPKIFQALGSGKKRIEVISGLLPHFSQRFSVFKTEETECILSEPLQQALLAHIDCFPLKSTSGYLAMIHLCPEGYSIICPRTTRQGRLDKLLKLAESISAAV